MDGESKRIVFLDWLRVVACFMVMVVHSCEPFYFDADGNTCFLSAGDAFWACWIDSAVRAAVPLFVMASSFLLFPLKRDTGAFFRRRFVRVLIPFFVWSAVYTVAWKGDWVQLAFNFPMATGGHMWFVPMLCGLYLLMPLLSPWAEAATEREVRGWLLLWLATTTLPFVRLLWSTCFGEPMFGAVPYLWGECPWNHFGALYYVSGFFGYLLLGLYFRRFVPELSWRRTLALAVPLWIVGMAIVGGVFYARIPGPPFPVTRPYALAVSLEASWEFCSTGVALTVAAYFLVLRKLNAAGWFHARIVRPLAEASYGTYLLHMLVLTSVVAFYRPRLDTPLTIAATAATSFVISSLASCLLRRIPVVGRFIAG